jgi:hypothetical protein
VHSVLALVDWDHRLPSRNFMLRVHLCDSAISLKRLENELEELEAYIQRRDLYPEFDVPDYDGPEGDESYAVDLTAELTIDGVRLISRWRREITDANRAEALAVVRGSTDFKERMQVLSNRDDVLGELEAVGWAAPCETGHPRWTVDVWLLTAFDGMIGRGLSFLVDVSPIIDPNARPVIAVREFAVRAG